MKIDLEKYWYETSPFLYTIMGGFVLGRADSVLMVISAILLLCASGTITLLRRKHSLGMMKKFNKPTKPR